MRSRSGAVIRIVGAGALCAASGCLDPAPVTVTATGADASGDATSAAAVALCAECIMAPDQPGPGCATEMAACAALPVCETIVACANAAGCFARGSLGAVEQCGLPCAAGSGLALGDPAYSAALQAFSCTVGPCGSACGLPEAGR